MAEYRIFRMTSGGGFTPGIDVHRKSDRAACELALHMIGRDQDAEVWSGVRLVRRISNTSREDIAGCGDD